MADTLSVLIVASEISPLASTGGLAEVTGSLPLALRDIGLRVAAAMPAYRRILESGRDFEKVAGDLPVRLGGTNLTADLLQGELAPEVPLYLVGRDELYDRSGLYYGRQGEFFDNPERYIFFSRAVPELCSRLGFSPDVILGNDWQTGLIMALLDLGALPRTAGVFTIHNQGFLGLVPSDRTSLIGLPDKYYSMNGLEYFGQMSLLKAGIVYADAVTTVSPTYAREIQTPEGGHGLDGVMRAVGDRLSGILNGVDYRVWDPSQDPHLVAGYSSRDLSGKSICKRELLRRMGLTPDLMHRPLLGMVARLTAQKGSSLVAEAAEELFKIGAGLVVLGTGEDWAEEQMRQLRDRYPDRFGLKIAFDPSLAHEIIAGCDLLLLPSLYEPCGLAQMFGLRYGTIPVVRATGGLNDTIRDPRHGNDPGTGFKFDGFVARELVQAVRRAIRAYDDPERWKAMIRAAMAEDFSWGRSAREYAAVFERALAARRG